MRKTLISFSAVAAFFLGTALSSFAACNYTTAQLANQLPFSMATAKIIKQTPMNDDICSVIIQAKNPNGQEQFVPVFTIGNNASQGVIIGTLFKNKQNVTGNALMDMQQNASKASFNAVKAELPSIAVATYKPTKPNGKVLYAFVDPLCPFCHTAESKLAKYANESGYTIKIMPFIVHGQPAYDKMASFICSKLNYADYIKGNYGNAKVCSQAKDLLTKSQAIDSKLGLNGTPTFFTGDGTMIVGANLVELKQALGIK